MHGQIKSAQCTIHSYHEPSRQVKQPETLSASWEALRGSGGLHDDEVDTVYGQQWAQQLSRFSCETLWAISFWCETLWAISFWWCCRTEESPQDGCLWPSECMISDQRNVPRVLCDSVLWHSAIDKSNTWIVWMVVTLAKELLLHNNYGWCICLLCWGHFFVVSLILQYMLECTIHSSLY